MNVALMMPLFYEYARNLRDGILEWVDRHPGWRIIEIDPGEQPLTERLAGHLHGAIVMNARCIQPGAGRWLDGLPLVNCRDADVPTEHRPLQAVVSFDRATIKRLAVDHFRELGFETAGYVGVRMAQEGGRAMHVSGMREMAKARGMNWVEFDLGRVDPSGQPEWVWEGKNHRELAAFLKSCPKPTAFLTQDDYVGTMLCELAASLGLKVPEDIAVLGQGDRVIGRTGFPALSTVVIPGRKIGFMAAEVMHDLLTGGVAKPRHQLVACEKIIVRASTAGTSMDIGIERSKRHFDKHALSGVTVQELATVAGCSVKTLRARFQENYGVEIAKAIRDRRKQAALHLLKTTDLDISEIGRRCGFASAPNFFNFVRRQAGGIGPAEYRRQARKETQQLAG